MGNVLIHQPGKSEVGPEILDSMFRLRYRVFKERLDWDVADRDHLERDGFDDLKPTYLIVHQDGEGTEACWRLLPTTGPYMLRDLFAELLDGQPAPVDARVWEISRFAAMVRTGDHESLAALSDVTSGMLVSLLRFGLANRIERIIAVSDLRFERILRRAGLKTGRLGQVRHIGACQAVAGWTDITFENLERVETRRCALLKAARGRAAIEQRTEVMNCQPIAARESTPFASTVHHTRFISSPL